MLTIFLNRCNIMVYLINKSTKKLNLKKKKKKSFKKVLTIFKKYSNI